MIINYTLLKTQHINYKYYISEKIDKVFYFSLFVMIQSNINSISSGCLEYLELCSSNNLVNSSINIWWYFSISSFVGLAIFGTSIGLPTVNNIIYCLLINHNIVIIILSQSKGHRILLMCIKLRLSYQNEFYFFFLNYVIIKNKYKTIFLLFNYRNKNILDIVVIKIRN